MKFTEAETLGYKTRLEDLLAKIKGLMSEMDVVEDNPNLSNDQKLEELKKIKEELNKVTLEIDIIKKGIKLMSTRHLN